MSAEHSLLSNPMLWYSLAVAIFVFFAVKLGRKPILAALDAEIAKIRDELERARQLKAEAEQTLASYKDRQAEALAEAAQIVAQAKKDATQLRAQAEDDIRAAMARNEQKALMRIAAAEKKAMQDVQAEIARQAILSAQKILAEKMDDARLAALSDRAIDEAISFAPALKGHVA